MGGFMPVTAPAPDTFDAADDDIIPLQPLDRRDQDDDISDEELHARDVDTEDELRAAIGSRAPLRIVDDATLTQQRHEAGERIAAGLALLRAKRDNRLDRVATLLGLPSTMDLRKVAPSSANDNHAGQMLDAETLLGMDFPPIKWVVPGFVVEGLTILGGRPKLGKSWLALGFCIAVASGGAALGNPCAQGDALYLALEDNKRRLQDRMRVVLPKVGRPNLSRMKTATTAPKVGAGLVEMLDGWRASAEEPRLVVIDTLAIVRPAVKRQQDSYAADYEALRPLQQWASQHRLAVIVVTHVRKMEAEDPLEMISGTNGLTGAADSILVLNRTADGPKLYGRGRDMEDVEKALQFDVGTWSVLGDVAEVKKSDQRRNIIAALQAGHDTPAQIAKALGVRTANVQYLLGKMVEAGEAERSNFGLYRLPSDPSESSESTDIYLPSESDSEGSEDSEGVTQRTFESAEGAALDRSSA
jgi:hypothetical protein